MSPLVSVIVPAYNASAYLQETLLSIVRSSYRPLEIVIVDDGSKDDSLAIAEDFARLHTELPIRVFTQANAGVSAARNHAIREAHGTYILPVDADDLISANYIAQAVAVLEQQPDVRVVGCRARMFDAVDKEWKLPAFSHALLARKNMIPVTSLFRRADWQAVGGFCEEDIYREDWDFWLSLFTLGGSYHLLDEVGLFYRVRPGSRRAGAKQQKRAIVDAINRRHADYMQRYLGGPLHYHRSWSRLLNSLRRETIVSRYLSDNDVRSLQQGEVFYQKRNTIRCHDGLVIKQFATPPLWRGILYGLFVRSKARRSYEYALRLGTLTPEPIAYREVRLLGVLRQSEYICRQSECRYTFNALIGHPDFPHRKEILQAIGRFTAHLHQQHIWHEDYSAGNILFNADGSLIQLVDLNRMRFRLPSQPLLGFERLNIDRQALELMVTAYAEEMHIDARQAVDFVISHRWHKHVKQGITNL